jgi:hypothetical protein
MWNKGYREENNMETETEARVTHLQSKSFKDWQQLLEARREAWYKGLVGALRRNPHHLHLDSEPWRINGDC